MSNVTTPNQWKKKSRSETTVTLPSGNVAVLCRPNLLAMSREGKLPNLLASFAMKGVTGQTAMVDMANTPQDQLMAGMAQSLSVVCKAAFVDPRISDTPTDDSIGIEHVDEMDQVWVLGWVLGADAETLKTFLGTGQAEAVDPVPDGADIQQASQRDIWAV